MSSIRADDPLVPSVLDRLIDLDPGTTQEVPKGYNQVLRELKQSVRRDLESLLNTRRRCQSWPKELTEVHRSLVSYGVPDFSRANLESGATRQKFEDLISKTLEFFEPRFVRVTVRVLENEDELDHTLRFQIDALLRAEPHPEPVFFETALEPLSQNIEITRVG